jgi:Putative sugar diacid recognition
MQRGAAVDRDLQDLAGRFLDFVHRATKLPMIVCDETGTIVECVDRRRIGTPHAFAKRILAGEADELFVTAEDVARDPRMKEGCNCVILLDGERVGTFGLTGSIEVARPLARIAAAVVVSWAKEERQRAALGRAADQVLAGMKAVAARAEAASAEAGQVTAVMTGASRDASARIEQADAIVRSVQEIAQKSRILSINGSVEAARGLRLHFPDLRVLFVSGYVKDAIARHGVLDPGIEFLAKPFTPASLLSRVRSLLDVLPVQPRPTSGARSPSA